MQYPHLDGRRNPLVENMDMFECGGPCAEVSKTPVRCKYEHHITRSRILYLDQRTTALRKLANPPVCATDVIWAPVPLLYMPNPPG